MKEQTKGFGDELRALWQGQYVVGFENLRDKTPAEPLRFVDADLPPEDQVAVAVVKDETWGEDS